MKLSIFFLWTIWICTSVSWAKGVSDEYLDAIRDRIDANLNNSDLTFPAEMTGVYAQLVRDDSDPNLCAKLVVQYYRGAYLKMAETSLLNYKTLVWLNDPPGRDISSVAIDLFLFKGKTEGLYEYTNLTNTCLYKIDRILDPNILGADPDEKLLIYVIDATLRESYFLRRVFYEKGYPAALDEGGLERFERLKLLYQEHPLFQRFVLNYIFDDWTYVGVITHAGSRFDRQKARDYFKKYYNSLIKNSPVETEFIAKAKQQFGADIYEGIDGF